MLQYADDTEIILTDNELMKQVFFLESRTMKMSNVEKSEGFRVGKWKSRSNCTPLCSSRKNDNVMRTRQVIIFRNNICETKTKIRILIGCIIIPTGES